MLEILCPADVLLQLLETHFSAREFTTLPPSAVAEVFSLPCA
jgi:hypothetical protein